MANHLTTDLLGRIQGFFFVAFYVIDMPLNVELMLVERPQFSMLLHTFVFALGIVSLFSAA